VRVRGSAPDAFISVVFFGQSCAFSERRLRLLILPIVEF
jgi:hypothetical protein